MPEWKMLGGVKTPICPIISAHTVQQANKYVECVKEKCMWWNKCKEGEGDDGNGRLSGTS